MVPSMPCVEDKDISILPSIRCPIHAGRDPGAPEMVICNTPQYNSGGLPPPLCVHPVRPPVLGAAETVVQEGAAFRLVQRIPFVPYPLALEPIANHAIRLRGSRTPTPPSAASRQALPRHTDEALVVVVHEEEEGDGEDEQAQGAGVLEGLHPPLEPPQRVRTLLSAAAYASFCEGCGKSEEEWNDEPELATIMTRWFTKKGSSASEAGKVFSGGKQAWLGEWEEKVRNRGRKKERKRRDGRGRNKRTIIIISIMGTGILSRKEGRNV
ncbi:hypothetical protein GW17_00035105 [Ensete ventricosum]|nr:hypothetical protein GW17_00035105 [Ensete ventricosum]